MERRRKMRFAIHKIAILFDKRFPDNITSAEFQTAQKTRVLKEQNVSTVADRYAGREIALVITLERHERNAKTQEIIFTEPSKEESPVKPEFQILPGKKRHAKNVRRMVLVKTVLAAQQNSRMDRTQIIDKLQFPAKRKRRKRILGRSIFVGLLDKVSSKRLDTREQNRHKKYLTVWDEPHRIPLEF